MLRRRCKSTPPSIARNFTTDGCRSVLPSGSPVLVAQVDACRVRHRTPAKGAVEFFMWPATSRASFASKARTTVAEASPQHNHRHAVILRHIADVHFVPRLQTAFDLD